MTLLAVLSDTHDQIAYLQAAVTYCNERGISQLAHCGDLISPFMLKCLAKFDGTVHLIYGNNVGDQHLISTRCGTMFPNIIHHGIIGDFKADEYTIGLIHYPDQARGLASQTIYDIVCCGHSHRHGIESYGKTLLVNPGHLFGVDDKAGFFLIDLQQQLIERVAVGGRLFDSPVAVRAEKPIDFSDWRKQ